jgi:hypothetical protein
MSDLRIAVLSTVYVKVPITATKSGTVVDPTGDDVVMAFTAVDVEPVICDWLIADWETIGGQPYARCLIGPDGGEIALLAGTYAVWVKVTDSPEIPVKPATNNLVIF